MMDMINAHQVLARANMNKEKYKKFCEENYVPIYSKPWWMDAVCGADNWDVWLYENSGKIQAAMPYYKQIRGNYYYITKAPLTQNNGLIISYPDNQKLDRRQSFEEKIIDEAVKYIKELGVDVYEQQYMYTFKNFLPFFWNGFTMIPRVTYVIEDTSDMERVEKGFSSNYRKKIKKGRKNTVSFSEINPEVFYKEHEKIFLRQGLNCPFSYDFWMKLQKECIERGAGEMIAAKDEKGTVLSLIFVVRDEKSMYLLLGGEIPEHSSLQTYTALVHHSIQLASQRGLKFDFEGSVIKRINHAMREYGGTPKRYFRIRKVFNSEIIMEEAKQQISQLNNEIQR